MKPFHSAVTQAARPGMGGSVWLPLLLLIGTALMPRYGWSQMDSADTYLPFAVGETLDYHVKLGNFGGGRGTMRIDGRESVRGQETWTLAFDFRARVVLAMVKDHSRSWLDPDRMASLRYQKRESSPISSHQESVEIYPEEHRWTAADGKGGTTSCSAPLDELSFIYYIRTLPLTDGAIHAFAHHFDQARNPVLVRVLGRERISVPAGEFDAVAVEMEVTDPRRYGGKGVIRFHISDDARRLPVRIESAMPVVGATVLSLERWTVGRP